MCRELNWTENTKTIADELLHEWVTAERSITSLDFKLELRNRVGRTDNITQADVGYFLRERFLREAYANSDYQASKTWLDDESDWYFVYEPLMVPAIIGVATLEEMYGQKPQQTYEEQEETQAVTA